MDHLSLSAHRRTTVGKTVDRLRRSNIIPAVLYGHDVKSVPLEIDAQVFQQIYRQAGATGLVDLTIDQAAPVKVLVHEVQRHPTRRTIIHVDFYQVRMTEKIEAEIELVMVGESTAVKESGGTLVRSLDKLKVECLPGDLVPSFPVDISALKTFEDRIHVGDIKVPTGITIMNQADEVVASVTPPRSEAELEALSGEVKENIEAVEVEKKGKEEGAEEEAATDQPAEAKPTTKKE
jgi:large subunit ribosomal protein L25